MQSWKLFPGRKKSSEKEEGKLRFSGVSEEKEEDESSFLENSKGKEDGSSFLRNSEEGEGELIAIKKYFDPDFLLKMYLMLISFSPEDSFFEELTFFDSDVFSVLIDRCEVNLQDE